MKKKIKKAISLPEPPNDREIHISGKSRKKLKNK